MVQAVVTGGTVFSRDGVALTAAAFGCAASYPRPVQFVEVVGGADQSPLAGLCFNLLATGARSGQLGQAACYAATSLSRSQTNWTASIRTEAPRPNARSTMRASPQMSRVMLKANARSLRSARITSEALIVA